MFRRDLGKLIVLGGAAAATATACSTEVGTTTTGGGADEDALTIFWKGSEEAGINAAVEVFREQNPDIEIIVNTADVEQYQATLRTQLSAGSAADVIFVWPGDGNPAAIAQIAPDGFLEDLSDREWVQSYPESLARLTQVDSTTYLMAPAVTCFGPWYNQAALDELGLEAPTSWAEVIPFCEAALENGRSAYAIGAATPNATQGPLYGLVPDLVYRDDPEFDLKIAAREATFSDNEGWLEATTRLQEMIDAGAFNEGATGTNQDAANQLVASGDALGIFAIGYQLSALTSLNPDTEYRFVPFTDDGSEESLVTISNAGGAAVNAASSKKELALSFIDFLASEEGITAYCSALVGAVPSNPAYATGDNEDLAMISSLLDQERAIHFLNQFWPNAEIEQEMYSQIQAMLTGGAGPADILAAMDAAL